MVKFFVGLRREIIGYVIANVITAIAEAIYLSLKEGVDMVLQEFNWWIPVIGGFLGAGIVILFDKFVENKTPSAAAKEAEEKECQETYLNYMTYLINYNPDDNSKRAARRRDEYAEKLMDKGIPVILLQDVNYMNECRMIIQELGLNKGIEEIKSKELEILDI